VTQQLDSGRDMVAKPDPAACKAVSIVAHLLNRARNA
jgi:hypothetical protein